MVCCKVCGRGEKRGNLTHRSRADTFIGIAGGGWFLDASQREAEGIEFRHCESCSFFQLSEELFSERHTRKPFHTLYY